jgi:lipopolysaccharide/colanic/teichoic acid biosynthesis glycosyltransferase
MTTIARPRALAARRPGFLRARPRRVVVIGAPWTHAAVAGSDPPSHIVFASAANDPRILERLDGAAWDETVTDTATLWQLQRSASPLLARAPVVVLDPATGLSVDELLRPPMGRLGGAFKRTVDIAVALLAATVALPLLLLAMLAIRLDSPGPAVFRQTRVGIGGLPFRCFKLRTMFTRNDDTEHQLFCNALARGEAARHDGIFKLADDPRITRVGRVLRRLSIDELPQLWNVLRGQMSVVGPRPCLPADTRDCDARYWARLRVRPGLTGPWQVGGRSRLPFDEMVALDLEYWRTWTPTTDLMLLLKTPLALLDIRSTA